MAPDSRVETFAAVRLHLNPWRWEGVPFFIRAGKRLPLTATEVLAELKRPPQNVFAETLPKQANYVRFRLGPERVAIAIGARTKTPGEEMMGRNIELEVCDQSGGEMRAYERLIGEAMQGDPTLFARQDAVEEAWRIVDPILNPATPVYEYDPGTWGPPEADAIVARVGGWHNPTGRE